MCVRVCVVVDFSSRALLLILLTLLTLQQSTFKAITPVWNLRLYLSHILFRLLHEDKLFFWLTVFLCDFIVSICIHL